MRETHDYKDTLFLPKTAFPMRAGLPRSEPGILAFWRRIDLYARLARAKGESFLLHDGPPYANGHLHLGHALNKILKDIILRARHMDGHHIAYRPGWDCHGLPIEWQVEESFRKEGQEKEQISPATFRRACREYARHWVGVQSEEFQRYGVLGDWESPYLTMHPDAELRILREFLQCVRKGLVYRGTRPVMWSPIERTALAEAEVEYRERKSPAIWVGFPVKKAARADLRNAHIVIWTTTPWTIPANLAICFGPGISYGLYRIAAAPEDNWAKPGLVLAMADQLVGMFRDAARVTEIERLRGLDASELGAIICAHPLAKHGFAHDVVLLPGDHVTDDAGTGFVHSAPAHGLEDFQAYAKAGYDVSRLETFVDADGVYTEAAHTFAGLAVLEKTGKKMGRDGPANRSVIEALRANETLLARTQITHSYPHSWRSKAPVLFRNTAQWFIAMQDGQTGKGLRALACEAIEKVAFVPPAGKNRLRAMLQTRPDWLISRQRAWGTPLAIFVHRETGQVLDDERQHAHVLQRLGEAGTEAWFTEAAETFLIAPYSTDDYEKVDDILDVWFDSGCTHVFGNVPDLGEAPVADLVLEGSDQHRGWFQSSLLAACATRARAPYRAVLTHGFLLDQKGRKMSKSLGNAVAPDKIISRYGADILRVWVASADYADDIRIGEEIIHSAVDSYRKLRNTLRYLLGALSQTPPGDVKAAPVLVDVDAFPKLERYMLHLMAVNARALRAAYAACDLKKARRLLFDFAAFDLSAYYLDIRKDCLYCDARDDPKRQAALAVMGALFEHLCGFLAPICAFSAEEAFKARYGERARDVSVHERRWQKLPPTYEAPELAEEFAFSRRLRRVLTGALEEMRRAASIGSSLEAALCLFVGDARDAARARAFDWCEQALIAQCMIKDGDGPKEAFRLVDTPGVAVLGKRSDNERCPRCWRRVVAADKQSGLCARCVAVLAGMQQVPHAN